MRTFPQCLPQLVEPGKILPMNLTRKKVNGIVVANISNLNIGLIDVDDEGITTAASSANTTPGVAADTNTVTLAAETINGVSITGGTSVETSIA